MLNPDRIASVPGSHHVSRHNFEPAVLERLDFPAPLRLVDSTLRKTLFTAGATTSIVGFLRIAEALAELGVKDESLNVTWGGAPQPSPQEWALMAAIAGRDFGFALQVYTDTLLSNGRDRQPVTARQTLEALAGAGVRIAAPGIVEAPDDEAQARQKDELAAYFDDARELGLSTTITLAQVGLRDFDRMVEMSNHAIALGATRLDLMDSSSSMNPDAMRAFVRRFRTSLEREVPITMHMHDEFGLATAGAIAAATAGASPDVSINGMSYRCGFAPLEEVVLTLETLYGIDTGIELERIQPVAELVARESGVALPSLKPLTGKYAYLKHLSGDVAAAIRTGQTAFPPISHGLVPARMGQRVAWVWGNLSSADMVTALAEQEGFDLDESETAEVRKTFDDAVEGIDDYPRWLEPAAAATLMHTVVEAVRTPVTEAELLGVLSASCPTPQTAEAVRAAHGERGLAGLAQTADLVLRDLGDAEVTVALHGFQPLGVEAGRAGLRGELSREEEANVLGADAELRALIVRLSGEYETLFGHPFVISTAGLSALEVLERLCARLRNDVAGELAESRTAMRTIVGNRIAKLSRELAAQGRAMGNGRGRDD